MLLHYCVRLSSLLLFFFISFTPPCPRSLNIATGIILCAFLLNSKKLNRAYETYVMSVGDLDERVFLGAFASEEVGTPIKVTSGSSVISDK